MIQEPYHERIAAWLHEQGHSATVDRHDDTYATVAFRSQGADFIVRTDDTDPDFLFITHRFDLPDSLQSRRRAHRLAHYIERSLKVVKVAIDWDNRAVEFNAEQFLHGSDFVPIFWRCVWILEEAARRFFEELRHYASSDAAERFIESFGQHDQRRDAP